MYIKALYAFHFVYFISYSVVSFLPKYFGEIGLSDSLIGLLLSIPAIAGVCIQPVWGALTDRVRLKRVLIAGLLAMLAIACFMLDRLTTFWPLLICLALYSILQLPIAPIYATISLEYTREIGKRYGPIRLVGTMGYQAGALLTGVLLQGSLVGIYRLLGLVMIASCGIACFMPPVRGHQHGRSKVPITALLRDKQLILLVSMIFIGTVTSQFYLSFFAKHLGDLHIDNATTGLMLFVSVFLELPFLLFADKLASKMSIWNWVLLGFGFNAARWIGIALSKSVLPIILFQIPAVTVMACFEYMPAVYVNQRVPKELKGSAQNALMLVSFGISKVVGSLLGGLISEQVGIPAVFAGNGLMMILAFAVFWKPTRRVIQAEKARLVIGMN